jgi:hypothetical protein
MHKGVIVRSGAMPVGMSSPSCPYVAMTNAPVAGLLAIWSITAIMKIMQKQLHPSEPTEPREVLDADTLRALEEGIRSENTGREYTWEEAKKFARERRKAWMTIPNSLND